MAEEIRQEIQKSAQEADLETANKNLYYFFCPTSPAREAPRQGDRKNNISFCSPFPQGNGEFLCANRR